MHIYMYVYIYIYVDQPIHKYIYIYIALSIYTRVDPIIPWSEQAELSAAEQSLVYKNIDFKCDFELCSKVIAKKFRTGQAISREF